MFMIGIIKKFQLFCHKEKFSMNFTVQKQKTYKNIRQIETLALGVSSKPAEHFERIKK